ncbi:MAG: methyltransferase domain-containing protein [Deltaproteobacteria bacterium]|nr:methyltransferase domain-containing protein [Deltaproteobacteria bacterium]
MPKTEPFEKYSNEYDEWFEKNRDLYDAELEAIRQLVPPIAARGMEVGVGTGKFAIPLGIKIGVDPSEKMAIKARKQGIEVYQNVAEYLPFNDARFEFVLMVTTICFVDDVLRSFKEAFRVLKHDGCIIVGFVDKESELGRRYSAKRENSKFYIEATFFSTKEVLVYLEEAGFGKVRIKQTLIPEEPQGTVLESFGKGAFVVIKGVK